MDSFLLFKLVDILERIGNEFRNVVVKVKVVRFVVVCVVELIILCFSIDMVFLWLVVIGVLKLLVFVVGEYVF